MTMARTSRTIGAGEFKTRCLALLDEIAEKREELVVTKRGRPVARVVPMEEPSRAKFEGSLTFDGDIVAPLDADWNADR
jgi:prevent-host-death family protein